MTDETGRMLAEVIDAYRAARDCDGSLFERRAQVAAWEGAAARLAGRIGKSPTAVELASITGHDEGEPAARAELDLPPAHGG